MTAKDDVIARQGGSQLLDFRLSRFFPCLFKSVDTATQEIRAGSCNFCVVIVFRLTRFVYRFF